MLREKLGTKLTHYKMTPQMGANGELLELSDDHYERVPYVDDLMRDTPMVKARKVGTGESPFAGTEEDFEATFETVTDEAECASCPPDVAARDELIAKLISLGLTEAEAEALAGNG